jgi:2,3-bisphosphoglycerate-independent phosphoglycerate mutase
MNAHERNEVTMKLECPLARAIREAYKTGVDDEKMEPYVLVDAQGEPAGRFQHGDSVIFYDLRGEREIELTQSLTDPDFDEFVTEYPFELSFTTLIEYDPHLRVKVAFPPEGEISNTLSEVVSRHGMTQAKVVESEKAVHLSFFLNGKRQEPFPGEERIFIPTPKGIANYDEHPEMEIEKVTDALIKEIEGERNLVVANFANTDVLGHIENKEAILQGLQAVDRSVERVVEAARKQGMTVMLTADHGTVEKWYYSDGTVDTGHTNSDVPFLLMDFAGYCQPDIQLRPGGALTDVAPTALQLLGIEKPEEMSGTSLIESAIRQDNHKPRRVLLLIVDGWGYREDSGGNLIHEASTPAMDRFFSEYPLTTLAAAGEAVGMPARAVGNSEAGHLHIGSGRVNYLDRIRVDRSISDGSYLENEAFVWAMDEAKKRGSALHLLGIVSFYSSHGSLDHLYALMRMAKERGVEKVFIHGFLGRRGERPEAGARYLEDVHQECKKMGLGQVVDVIGRFWSLDREHNWDRIEKTYRMLVEGQGNPVPVE